MIREHQMIGKVNLNAVCRFFPYSGKEIPTKVEKDFTAFHISSVIASWIDVGLYNYLKILFKRIGFSF